MKADTVKLILSLALALLLGFVCEIIAPETDGRNWISLAVGFATIAGMLIPAMGLKYRNPRRGVSIKVFAWIMALAVTLTNIFFARQDYKIDIYLVVTLLLVVIGWAVIYGMFSAKEAGPSA